MVTGICDPRKSPSFETWLEAGVSQFKKISESALSKRAFNPFVPNAPFLYPLKTSENRKVFSGGREMVHLERMG